MIFGGGWRARVATVDDEEWGRIATVMVTSLAAFLHRSLSVDRDSVSLGKGFSVRFRTDDHEQSVWDLRVRGIVGGNAVDDRLLIRCWLFLYSGSSRIAPPEAEYLELELVSESGGTWRTMGWGLGFSEEFDSFLMF
jgi:hypothetical protein